MVLQDETPVFGDTTSQKEVLLYAALASQWREPPKDALDKLVLEASDAAALGGYEMLRYTPFDAAVKRTESTVREAAGGRVIRASKGAAHVIAALLGPGSEADRAKLDAAVDALASRGVRSLAVAKAEGESVGQWALVGLLTFLDPPRPDTAETLRRVAAMGVGVKMITGDNTRSACSRPLSCDGRKPSLY